MALTDLDVLDERDEDGILPAARDLGIDHRRRVRDRRDADLEPERLPVCALTRAADADPAGHVARNDVRERSGRDRRADAVGDACCLMARVCVSLGAVGAGSARLGVGPSGRASDQSGRGRRDDQGESDSEEGVALHLNGIGRNAPELVPRSGH